MTLPINPDVEVLQTPPLTHGQRLRAFETAIAHYAKTRNVLRDASYDISAVEGEKPEVLRQRLRTAAQADEAARRTIVAQALVLMATGVIERCAEALDAEIAGRP